MTFCILSNQLCSTYIFTETIHNISNFSGMNSIQLDVVDLKFRSDAAIVWHLWPLSKHNSVYNVFVRSSNKRLLLLGSVSMYVKMMSGLHMTVYLGNVDPSLNSPFNILQTFWHSPNVFRSFNGNMADRANLATAVTT